MTGVATAFGGKMSPELIALLVDDEGAAERLHQRLINKQVSKLPPLHKLPPEVQNAIDQIRKQNGDIG